VPQNIITVITFQMSIDCDPSLRVSAAIKAMQDVFEKHDPGICVFPEYYLNHFYPDPHNTIAAAQSIPGPATELLLTFTKQTGCTIVMGMLEKSKDTNRPFNSAVILGPNGLIGCYRKTHLWDLGPQKQSYRECKLFTPGNDLSVFDINGWKIGIMICADGMFPETARSLALKGADVILYPNSREEVGIEAEAAAYANVIPVVVSNPTGFNGADQCQGTSRIISPAGQTLAAVEGNRPGWVAAKLDLNEIIQAKTTACVRRLRRPELYSVLTYK
jgi:predicted amidohydrolase